MKLLQGKTTLITGGSRGIGKGIAQAYAREGANVAITYIQNPEPAEALQAEIKALGVDCLIFNCDATDAGATNKMVEEIVAAWGSLEVVVNNAGITKDTLLMRMSDEQFDQVIRTNLHSVFYATKAAIKPMMKQRKGSFINMSSVVGVSGNAGQANYAASKGGIIAFTKSVAKELASRNIRANAIAPGYIATEMTAALHGADTEQWLKTIPLARAGTPEDIAGLAIFLASDLSSYITGQVIHVDGGMHM
jgi:3-oxoacyl-[acyl-carrier protein] reductase